MFPPVTPRPHTGEERMHLSGRSTDLTVLDFWRWTASDLLSNATRGRLAEFIVASALGIAFDNVRDEWGAFDLLTPEGIKVEVKSAAYIQSWYQRALSLITFRVPKTRAWNPETNLQELEAKRQADVYVFAVLAHQDQATVDPLKLDQWRFYVLPTTELDVRTRSQHSITLRTLERNSSGSVGYEQLRSAVVSASSQPPSG